MTANQSLSLPDSPTQTGRAHSTKNSATADPAPLTDTSRTVSTVDVAEVLDLLADDYVCDLLRALDGEPMAARELAEACGMSRATVYRRLDRLTAAGLVDAEMCLAHDGHHRQRFRLIIDELEVSIGADGLDGVVRVADGTAHNRS